MYFILAIQAVLAVLLILVILLQTKAAGLSSALGGASASMQVQRRGAERALHRFTIILSILFFALTVVDWYI